MDGDSDDLVDVFQYETMDYFAMGDETGSETIWDEDSSSYSWESDDSSVTEPLAKLIENYDKNMERYLETVFVFEEFLQKEKDAQIKTNEKFQRLFVQELEANEYFKHSSDLKAKIFLKQKSFESKFLLKQTNAILEKLKFVLNKYHSTMLKAWNEKSDTDLKHVHDQSVQIAEEELHTFPYLVNNSNLWTDTKKQLTATIAELQKPFQGKQLVVKPENNTNARIQTLIDASDVKVIMSKLGLLGRGGFGTVRAGFIEYYGIVAIKVPLFRGSNMEMESVEKKYIREIELLHQANHENILRILGYSSYKDSMAIITEYMPGGSLRALLFCQDDEEKKFLVPSISNALRLRFCSDVSQGVSYLHFAFFDQRVVHGDLKPSNILLTSDLKCKV